MMVGQRIQYGLLLMLWLDPSYSFSTLQLQNNRRLRINPLASSSSATTAQPSDANPTQSTQQHQSALSCTIDELAKLLGGKGRAKLLWKHYYQHGDDPLEGFADDSDSIDNPTRNQQNRQEQQPGQTIGYKTLVNLFSKFGRSTINDRVASLSHTSVAQDGTTKILLELHGSGGMEVEAVIIPWERRQSSTLCISSQVGCRQACTFCRTGRMGLLHNLSADEILAQVWWAQRIVAEQQASQDKSRPLLYPIDNIVFMGMGEPADNAEAVVRAATILADPHQFALSPRRITISTVAPTPQAFSDLGSAPAVLAWSVHATRDALRRELVPTTRHSMDELRQGLLDALTNASRASRRQSAILLEIALLEGINDNREDAEHLIEFCQPLLENSEPSSRQKIKLVVNLIPWNDIAVSQGPAAHYRTPSPERVRAFADTLKDAGILCRIRTQRGDDESAACGQLATQKRKKSAIDR